MQQRLALSGLMLMLVLIPWARPAQAAHGHAVGDACELLGDGDIQSVQGEAVSRRQASSTPGGGLVVSQCYFALPTASKSVSLSLTQRGQGSSAQDPRRRWRSMFGKDRDRDAKGKGEPEGEEEAATPPEKVAGLGDAAYWSASPVGGVLYVLKGHRILSISVGGPGDAAEKMEKSKTLARFALKRL
jgi:hypothetical protein